MVGLFAILAFGALALKEKYQEDEVFRRRVNFVANAAWKRFSHFSWRFIFVLQNRAAQKLTQEQRASRPPLVPPSGPPTLNSPLSSVPDSGAILDAESLIASLG